MSVLLHCSPRGPAAPEGATAPPPPDRGAALGRRRGALTLLGVVVTAVCAVLLDLVLLPGRAVAWLYGLPVLLAATGLSVRWVALIGTAAVATQVLTTFLEPGSRADPAWPLFTTGAIVLTAMALLLARVRTQLEREVRHRQIAVATARQQYLQAAAAIQARDALATQVPVVVWTTDATEALHITSTRGAALTALGYPPRQASDPQPPTLAAVMGPEQADLARAAHQRALDGEQVTYRTVWHGRHWHVTVGPLRAPEGPIVGVTGVAVDVTEQRERERLDAALLVARTAAHRVNNALAPVVSYTHRLTQHPAVQADARLTRFATVAERGAQRAAAEIARLQRIVRLEEDQTVALPVPVLDLDRSTAPVRGGGQPG